MSTKPNEVDPLIKKAQEDLKAENTKLKEQERDAERQQRNQESVNKHAKSRMEDINRDVEKGIKLSQETNTKANDMIRTAQSGFETFASAMSSIHELTTQLAGSIELNSPVAKIVAKVREKAMPVADSIGINIASWVKKKLDGSVEYDIPELVSNVSLNAHGVLEVGDVTAGIPNISTDTRSEVNDAFKHGIKLWLKLFNFEESPRGSGKYRDKDSHEALTAAKFNHLRDLPDVGLNHFLSKQFQMGVKDAPDSPSPSI